MASDMPAPPASRPPLQYRVRALQLVTIGLALGVWETAARAGWIDPLFVPAPGAVGAALGTIGGTALAALRRHPWGQQRRPCLHPAHRRRGRGAESSPASPL